MKSTDAAAPFPAISLIIAPDQHPAAMVEQAREAESAGVREVWLWEDCFAQSGIAPAAAILASTARLRVGLGIMPVPLRNVALTAMEVATIAQQAPGRFLPGIGHGVLDWMGQAGVRAQSPLTLLREQALALRALLAGEEVTTDGRYVQLDRVQLRWPPAQVPPLLIAGGGPKTLAVAGALGDGIVLAGELTTDASLQVTRDAVALALEARAAAGVDAPLEVVQFVAVPADASPQQLLDIAAANAESGATSVPMLPLGPDGQPDRGERILRLAEAIGEASR